MSTIERALVWIIGVAILGLVLWSAFIKPSDKTINQPNSQPVENHNNEWPLSHLLDFHLSCERQVVSAMEGKKK